MKTSTDFKKEKQKIDLILSKAKNILITAHKQPDSDAIGSVIAFKWYVDNYFPNTKTKIVFSGSLGDLAEKLSFLEGANTLETTEDISNVYLNFDTLVFLDGSEVARTSEYPERIDLEKMKSICIDHHQGEHSEFDYYFRDTSFASCAEIVCEILCSDEDLTDKALAEPLFIGIHGDTGGFTFVDNEKAKVFSTARRIVENGDIVVQNLLQNLSGLDTLHFEFIQVLIKNTTNVAPKDSKLPPFTYSYFAKEDVEKFSKEQVKPGRAYYISRYLRKINGHAWGFVITPDNKKENFGLSLRSLPGSLNVQKLAKEFDGGGHIHASGGTVSAKSLGMSEKNFKKLDGQEIAERIIKRAKKLFNAHVITLTPAN